MGAPGELPGAPTDGTGTPREHRGLALDDSTSIDEEALSRTLEFSTPLREILRVEVERRGCSAELGLLAFHRFSVSRSSGKRITQPPEQEVFVGNKNRNHASETEQELQAIMKGIPSVVPSGKNFFFKGINYDQQGFTQLVAGFLNPYESVQQLRAQLEQGVVDRDSMEDAARQFVSDIKAASITNYGEGSVEFSQLGFKSKKKAAPLSPEKKQLRYARLMATRKARNVMGKRQRLAVKGVVPPTGTEGSPDAPSQAGGSGASGGNAAKS
jgi:hypothetical protein